jgi:hypothetical protein
MRKRRLRLEKHRERDDSPIDTETCLILGGFEAKPTRYNGAECVTYWEAVKEELYTRIFSITPCEIYCNWIQGRKLIALLLVVLTVLGAFAHCLFISSPIYVHCWIFLATISAFLAPFHALVWLSPLAFGARHRLIGLYATGFIVLRTIAGLIVGKHSALKHEQRLITRFFRKNDLWTKTNVGEKTLLYLLGFDGFF